MGSHRVGLVFFQFKSATDRNVTSWWLYSSVGTELGGYSTFETGTCLESSVPCSAVTLGSAGNYIKICSSLQLLSDAVYFFFRAYVVPLLPFPPWLLYQFQLLLHFTVFTAINSGQLPELLLLTSGNGNNDKYPFNCHIQSRATQYAGNQIDG